MADITTLIDLITRGGLVSALIIALVGGWKGWYVWGPIHTATIKEKDQLIADTRAERDLQVAEVRKDRDFWRDQAIRCLSSTERVASIFEATQRKLE